MALYTRAQFCKLAGISQAYLFQYIKRGNIIATHDKSDEKKVFIDDQIAENSEFLYKKLQEQKAALQGETPPEIVKPEKKVIAADDKVKVTKEVKNKIELEAEKKKLEVDKLKEEVDILRAKSSKIHGESIPTDIVEIVFAQHFKSITVSFKNAADNLITKIAKQYNFSREEAAKYRGEIVDVTNKAIDEAINESKKSLANLVQDTSEKKGVGERE